MVSAHTFYLFGVAIGAVFASQTELATLDGGMGHQYETLFNPAVGGYDDLGGAAGSTEAFQGTQQNNLNSVLDLLVGEQHSVQRNKLHAAFGGSEGMGSGGGGDGRRFSHRRGNTLHGRHQHMSRQQVPDAVDLITMSERDLAGSAGDFDEEYAYEDGDQEGYATTEDDHALEEKDEDDQGYGSRYGESASRGRSRDHRHHGNHKHVDHRRDVSSGHRSGHHRGHSSRGQNEEDRDGRFSADEESFIQTSAERDHGRRHHDHHQRERPTEHGHHRQQQQQHALSSNSQHRRERHRGPRGHKGPAIAELINELEVSGDGPGDGAAPAASFNQQKQVSHERQPEKQEQPAARAVGKGPDPHLRDELMHGKKLRGGHDHSGNAHVSGSHTGRRGGHGHGRGPASRSHGGGGSSSGRGDDDDVPLDEFGLRKDCNSIHSSFASHSDSCDQCMSVADAFFKDDNVCACFKDKPGLPMRTRCDEMAGRFVKEKDQIRDLVIERGFNEYYKSYGLCEAYSYCGQ